MFKHHSRYYFFNYFYLHYFLTKHKFTKYILHSKTSELTPMSAASDKKSKVEEQIPSIQVC